MNSENALEPNYSNIDLIKDLLRFLRPYRYRYAFATFLRLIGDIARLYPPIAAAAIVTMLSSNAEGVSTDLLWWYVFSASAAYVFHVVGRQFAKLIGYKIAERIALDAKLSTIEHLFLLDLSWHEKENSGNKLKRMEKGGEGIVKILRIWLTNFIEIGVNFVGITIILATIDASLSITFVCYIIIYFFLSMFFTRRGSLMAHKVNVGEEKLHGIAFEAVNNIRSVKVLGMGQTLKHRIDTVQNTLFCKIKKRIFWFQTRYLAVDSFSVLFRWGVIAFIAFGIIQGHYEVGLLVLFIDYFAKITQNTEELAMVTLDFTVAKYGVSRMTELLSEEVRIDDPTHKREVPPMWNNIHIENLSFGYEKDQDVLHNLSFSIQKGEKVGIVGVSGAGKSTLFKLLLKEHENYSGSIKIDDTPLSDIRRTDFFRYAAVVLQETEVFNFSLRDNITLGNPKERNDEALLEKAIAVAHVGDFMDKLPEGLDTPIGEKGVKLSGGEKQRVGIARAIFKKPEILFLDEATSHLDMESEEKIKDSLHQFFQQVTAIVIAHRLSTIKEMDRIILIEHGQIKEMGSFEELYSAKGRFFELWEKQKF